MTGLERQVADLVAVLRSGFAGQGPGRFPAYRDDMGGGHEMYRAVRGFESGVAAFRDFIGPIVGRRMGMQLPMHLPHVAPEQGIGEAYYASRVTSRQWELTRNEALYDFSVGMAGDLSRLGGRLGLPRLLGMGDREFGEAVRGMASTEAGAALAARALDLSAVQNVMGGDPMALYSDLFANRHLFGGLRGRITSPMDVRHQEFARNAARDVGHALTYAIRGAQGGGFGILPHFAFTHGFRDEEISQVVNEIAAAGGFGDIGPRMLSAAHRDFVAAGGVPPRAGGGPETMGVTGDLARHVGSAMRVFASLRDLTGVADFDRLNEILSELGNRPWQQLDRGALDALSDNLRELEATAQVLNVSKDKIMTTVTGVNRALQGAVGVTPGQLAAGFGGGAYGGLPVATEMTQRIFAIAHVTGRNRPEDIERIAAQQIGLDAIGLRSPTGRVAQLLEYGGQEGIFSNEFLDHARSVLRFGTPGERRQITEEILTRKFGSVDAGRRRVDDPIYMRYVRERTEDPAVLEVMDTIGHGRLTEWGHRVIGAQRDNLERTVRDVRRATGQRHTRSPDVVGEEAYATTMSFLLARGQGPDVDAAVARVGEEWDAHAHLPGRERYRRVRAFIGGDPLLRNIAHDLDDAVSRRTTLSDAYAQADRLHYDSELRVMGDALRIYTAGDEDIEAVRTRHAEIRELSRTDPRRAHGEMAAFVETRFDANEMTMLRAALDNDRTTTRGRRDKLLAGAHALSRGLQGAAVGLSPMEVGYKNSLLTDMLRDLDTAMRSGDEQEIRAARERFGVGLTGVAPLLSGSELQRLSELGAHGTADAIRGERSIQGRIDSAKLAADAAVAAGLDLPIDVKQGIDDLRRASREDFVNNKRGIIRQQITFNRGLATIDAGLRASIPQLGLAYGLGDIPLSMLLGVEEGMKPVSDEAIQAQWKAVAEAINLPGHAEAFTAGIMLEGEGEKEFRDAVGAAPPEQRTRMRSMHNEFMVAAHRGQFKSEADVDKFLGQYGEVGAGPAGAALRKSWRGRSQATVAQHALHDALGKEFRDGTRLKGAVDATAQYRASEAARKIADRTMRREAVGRMLMYVGDDALSQLGYSFDVREVDGEKEPIIPEDVAAALGVLAPGKETTREQISYISRKYSRPDSLFDVVGNEAKMGAVEVLSDHIAIRSRYDDAQRAREAAKRGVDSWMRRRRVSFDGNEGGGVGVGAGGKLRIEGTLRMVDAHGNKVGDAVVNASS